MRGRIVTVLVNTVIVFRLAGPVRGKSKGVFRLTAPVRGKYRPVFRLSKEVSADPVLK